MAGAVAVQAYSVVCVIDAFREANATSSARTAFTAIGGLLPLDGWTSIRSDSGERVAASSFEQLEVLVRPGRPSR